MPWDDNNVSKLRELWDQGLPTAQIGKLLGFTKNAVVGKAHRIGLERRPSPIRRTAVKPDRKKARSPIIPKLKFEVVKDEVKETAVLQETFQPVVKNLFTKNVKGAVNGLRVIQMSLTSNFVVRKDSKINHIALIIVQLPT